ncbi:ParB/RepB/Spo0J family partition protein [Apilactobacillus timberlakei]|uniref:ParB/RepB/Spo0J family partition protein n=1 Tax=Apilactobacillus timberlakei TaxID=2008380 RepID=UPI001128FB96|nr:ParB/RepB/Spo0J family partition protein [Apilactobacillus timberlakei]TPR13054.1 ParB/RepB/Spo0J family partition protein [Apilactobacillus timberlakei]TPR17996.1 ParB/RepB/Spo0J family partition protein [Apilactobacillus timberlakei]TPR19053.1 ParB/RepB/Spo0J family partition protein [Apilactobacillus timberlakei]TPR19798.1 ParB/RepB/Spo0J family partition protein [Apilactobacillus timberlakei]TPR21336.1 ParB/RepB/Spo0J family partition protein [Apilactobacillus timberlakei]
MANNKGLGRGIEALFADNDVEEGQEEVIDLSLAKLSPNPFQPRTHFDTQALKDLTLSIKKSGVFQPIIVRKQSGKEDSYEILAGERRFRASRMANKQTIPAIIRDASDEQMMEIAVLENLQREDLNPIEEAEAYNTLMTKLDITQAEVSKRLGKSRPYIANYLRLLGLPTVVKEMLTKNQLSMGQARTLLSVKDKQNLIKLAKRAYNETLTVRQLSKAIDELTAKPKKKRKPRRSTKQSPFLRAYEDELQDKFGTNVNIASSRSKKGSGKLEINYTSDEDLNRILQILDINLD